jgi:peptidoglycan L-alanyl-D-glutamate endopeptidase CwlK
MTDQRTLQRIQLLHPKVRTEAEQIYSIISKELTGKSGCRFTHTLRTFAEQDQLYAIGRTKPGRIVTNAKGGYSFHNYGLAIDIVLMKDNNNDGIGDEAIWDTKIDIDGDGKRDWIEVVNVFKQYGWTWGGDWRFSDPPHFEKTFGKSVRELLALHTAKKVDKNGFVLI